MPHKANKETIRVSITSTINISVYHKYVASKIKKEKANKLKANNAKQILLIKNFLYSFFMIKTH